MAPIRGLLILLVGLTLSAGPASLAEDLPGTSPSQGSQATVKEKAKRRILDAAPLRAPGSGVQTPRGQIQPPSRKPVEEGPPLRPRRPPLGATTPPVQPARQGTVRPPGSGGVGVGTVPTRQPGQRPSVSEQLQAKPKTLVDWSYWRMNHPQVIFGVVRQVKQGKSPRSALNGALPRSSVDAALATTLVNHLPQGLTVIPGTIRSRSTNPNPAKPGAFEPRRLAPAPVGRPLDEIAVATPARPSPGPGSGGPEPTKGVSWTDVVKVLKPVADPSKFKLMADYSPDRIDFEAAPYWMIRTKALKVTSPTHGNVTVSWKAVPPQKISALPPKNPAGSPFHLVSHRAAAVPMPEALTFTRMVSYTGEIKNGQPVVDKEVVGGGPLAVKAGQDFLIEVRFTPPARMGGVSGTMVVESPYWSFEVPVTSMASDIEKYDIAAEWTQSTWVDTVQGGAPAVGLKLRNKGYYPVTVSLNAQSLPVGIGMNAFTPVQIAPGKEVMTSVAFSVAGETPEGYGTGKIRADLSTEKPLGYDLPALDFYVRKTWVAYNVPYHQCGDSDVSFSMDITYSYDGSWYFRVNAHDDGTFFGDQYVAYFVFNAWLDGKQLAATVMDKLDPDETRAQEKSGIDARIHDNWPAVYDQGLEWHIVTNSDATAFIKWYAETLLSLMTSG